VQAVVFGPGRIGCDLVGLASRAARHEATFVGRDPNLGAHLRRVGGYRVLLTGGDAEVHEVDEVACMDLRDDEDVTRIAPDADPVVTAVGSARLAAGLAWRGGRPLTGLALENEVDRGRRLARVVGDRGLDRSALRSVSFVSALAHRVVLHRLGDVGWAALGPAACSAWHPAADLHLTRSTWAARLASLLPLEGRLA
jgi:hypothetical protein